jgi:ABC-type uncharacterized transport system auxiliary subunit
MLHKHTKQQVQCQARLLDFVVRLVVQFRIYRHVRKIAKKTVSFVMSAFLSAANNSAPLDRFS